jgi:aminoglycoside phosphotransferase (APT) family kinase protein
MLHPGVGFEGVISTLSRNASLHFGSAAAEFEALQRHDGPFSRVLRVRVTAGARVSHAYIKVFTPKNERPEELARVGRFLKREYEATRALDTTLQADPEIGALRPIAYLPDHLAIVTEEVPGRPFGKLLADPHADPKYVREIAGRIGRWVLAYQTTLPQPEGRIDLLERREYVDVRLRQLEGTILSARERADVLATIDRLIVEVGGSTVPAVPIHADLNPMNVIVSDAGRVTVLDFTMAKSGTRVHDLSHLYFHVGMHAVKRPGRARGLDGVQAALLAGYSRNLSADDPLFRLVWWQHAICHLAFLAERPVGLMGPAYRWFVGRRWRKVRSLDPQLLPVTA